MKVDDRVAAAIRQTVTDVGQPAELADRIIAWFDNLASGNARLSDRDSTERHLELLYRTVLATDDPD